ncbi:hypothetical protein L218DRAFT_625197 [Marasmius fiardii PR-910]|nr:hypothetical protein L218DRAFT_625197 [Marasmius fiardii PR-910]
MNLGGLVGRDDTPAETARMSKTLASVVSFLVVITSMLYIVAFLWCYRCAKESKDSRPLNKKSGTLVQRYAPFTYVFIVLNALAQIGISAWLLVHYHLYSNYPNIQTLTSVRLLLFAATWTSVVAGTYTLLFLHPTWSGRPISSIGAQMIWVILTWVCYAVGTGLLNSALPDLFIRGTCESVVHCQQIQALFALSVVQLLVLTGAEATLVWLAWLSTQPVINTWKTDGP